MQIPIVVFCFLIAGIVISLIFCCAFFIELIFNNPDRKNKKVEEIVVEDPVKEEEFDLNQMLEKLNEESDDKSEEKTEGTSPAQEESSNEEIDFESMFARLEESIKKAQDESETKVEEEKKEQPKDEPVKEEPQKEEKSEKEEKLEKEEKVNSEGKKEKKSSKTIIIVNEGKDEAGSVNYEERLAKLEESLEKLEKDLAKSQKEINKYERTEKRKARNEKLLDKKASELTNLNLVMYSVNDIKDVDPEKKQKQEELVAHIAELKQTIVDADEYLKANKDKNANSKKLNSYLTKEKARYEEEIAELKKLITEAK